MTVYAAASHSLKHASRRCVIQFDVAEVADVTDRQTTSFDTDGSAVTLSARTVSADTITCNADERIYRVAQKWHSFLYALTLSNINRFSKLFHCQNQEKTCNNTVTIDPTTPHATLPCEMSSVSEQQLKTRRLL